MGHKNKKSVLLKTYVPMSFISCQKGAFCFFQKATPHGAKKPRKLINRIIQDLEKKKPMARQRERSYRGVKVPRFVQHAACHVKG